MSRYLVTGGAGFIGSHLVERLLDAGQGVTVLDNLSSGRRENVPAGATLIEGDIGDPDAVARAMADGDGCFHLAAIASVPRSLEDWPGTHRTNLSGTIQILDAARRRVAAGAACPVVLASSAAVYGDVAETPIAETAPLKPLSAYGADKLGSEQHAAVAWTQFRVPTTALRFFNVYGPRQDPSSPYSGVISIFLDRIAHGQAITIHGDGEQTRDFIYVADVAEHLVQAMRTSLAGARVFNVCTGVPTSVRALAHAIAGALDRDADIRHGPPRDGDIKISLGTRTAAAAAFALAPPIPLADGLDRLVSWLGRG